MGRRQSDEDDEKRLIGLKLINLYAQRDVLQARIKQLSVEQIRSPLYQELMDQLAELNAKISTLLP